MLPPLEVGIEGGDRQIQKERNKLIGISGSKLYKEKQNMSCNSEYLFGGNGGRQVRVIPTKEMTLKFNPERTDRASLAMK